MYLEQLTGGDQSYIQRIVSFFCPIRPLGIKSYMHDSIRVILFSSNCTIGGIGHFSGSRLSVLLYKVDSSSTVDSSTVFFHGTKWV